MSFVLWPRGSKILVRKLNVSRCNGPFSGNVQESFFLCQRSSKWCLSSSEQYSPMGPETQQIRINRIKAWMTSHIKSVFWNLPELCVYNCASCCERFPPISSNMKAQMNEIKNTTHEFFIARWQKWKVGSIVLSWVFQSCHDFWLLTQVEQKI